MWTLVLGALLTVNTANAQSGLFPQGPYCQRDHSGNIVTCTQPTWEECLFTIRGLGGTCDPNPNYKAPHQRAQRRSGR